MKQVYLILAAMMLLCLAPMPYGYYMLVRFVAMVTLGLLLPQWLTLPSTREAHCGRVNNRVLREQGSDIRCEGVRLINGVEPIGDVAARAIASYISYPYKQKMSRPGTLHSLRTRSGGGFYWVQRYDFLSKHPNDLAKKCIKR